jgi:hypothetical protein
MTTLFSNHAGEQLLASLREVFKEKRVYHRKHRFIVFVCGGKLAAGETSLRKQFIQWAETNLPEFICLLAEEALKDSFSGEGRTFVNLAKFETVIADVADCVVIFPESAGSWAETGFFANSKVRNKTLVANPLLLQTVESFLNLGPIDTIARTSFLKPTVLINVQETIDFAPIGERLKERIKWPEHRERLPYQQFRNFNFKQKLLVVFETLRLLRMADMKTLRYALNACFDGKPQNQELTQLLRILLAAKFIQRDAEYFRTAAGLNLIEIEHLEVEKVFARVQFFYQKYSRDLYDALSGEAP